MGVYQDGLDLVNIMCIHFLSRDRHTQSWVAWRGKSSWRASCNPHMLTPYMYICMYLARIKRHDTRYTNWQEKTRDPKRNGTFIFLEKRVVCKNNLEKIGHMTQDELVELFCI